MSTSRGNALFLILIAVALFAALSYAITQSGRGSGSTQKENEVLAAAQLSQTIGMINQAVMRMNVGGQPMSSIKFYNGTNGDCGGAYTFCNSGSDCVFAPDGGGVALSKPPVAAVKQANKGAGLPGQPSTFNTTNMWIDCNESLGDWGMGTSAVDRGFYFLNVSRGVCRAYNKALGIDGIPNEDAGANPVNQPLGYCYQQTVAPNAGDYEIFNMLYVQ
jgi:hypothetical protein